MSLPYFRLYPTNYEAKTAHLSLIEDGAYNRLLRLCWMTPGCSLPDDEDWIMRRMRVRDDAEREAVRSVLAEYFERADERLLNSRLMQEHQHARERHQIASKNSVKRWSKNKPLETNEKDPCKRNAGNMRAQCGRNANQNQNQNYNTPIPPEGAGGFDEFWKTYPRKVGKAAAQRAYAKAAKETDPSEILGGLTAQLPALLASDVQYQPHPATWLNQGRWADEVSDKAQEKEPWEYWL